MIDAGANRPTGPGDPVSTPGAELDPEAARLVLLVQHDQLRGLLAALAEASARVIAGEPALVDLIRTSTAALAAFIEHNETEERLLVPMLTVDPAWGPARVARMLEEHAAEHVLFRQQLGAGAAVAVADVIEEIVAHMDAEERTFLSPAVLRRGRGTAAPPSAR